MSTIIRDENTKGYLTFDRFVRDMEIVTTCEPVINPASADEFTNEDEARSLIKECETGVFDVSNIAYVDKDVEIKRVSDEHEAAIWAKAKEAWENTSEGRKQEILKAQLAKSPEALKEWLDHVEPGRTYSAPAVKPKFCGECGSLYGTCIHTAAV
jgi:hypothetical protein